MNAGELATSWTVRAALGCYFATLVVLAAGSRTRRPKLARGLWTTGCGLYLAHVACAFHFYHAWSHAQAYESTARATAELTGWQSGAGLYVNYLFTAVWLADVLWWWLAPVSRRGRPGFVDAVGHGLMLFVVVNATMVFEAGPTRWLSAAACAAIAATWLQSRRNRPGASHRPAEPSTAQSANQPARLNRPCLREGR